MVVWLLMAFGSRLGYVTSIIALMVTGHRVNKAMKAQEAQPRDVVFVASRGLWSAALQLASAICRHYWPLALVAAALSRRCRRVVLIAAIVDGVVDWLTRRRNVEDDAKPIGLVAYLLLKRLDDMAYGTGLWTGVVRERNVGPLKPQIRT